MQADFVALAVVSMENSKRLWRALLFFLLIAALCGSFAFPVVNMPVNAAPPMQATSTSCLGSTIVQWTFAGNSTLPSTGNGVFVNGSGVNGPTYPAGQSTEESPAISYSGWATTPKLGPIDFIEFQTSTLGRDSISFSFDSRISGTGPATFEVHYSFDGSAFTQLGLPSNSDTGGNWDHHAFDFTSVDGFGNATIVYVRLYGYSSAPQGTWRVDNVTFTGNCLFPADTETPSSTVTSSPTTTPSATGTPTLLRSVIINEVAWSGTAASSTDEWFELYNNTGEDINLSGWRLVADDGNPDIALSGTISANDPYFVFARNNGVFKDLVPDKIYSSGSFENNPSAEVLMLLDPNGNQVDTANLDGDKWNGGNGNPTYESMERLGTLPDGPDAWSTYGGTIPVAHDRNGKNIRGTPGQENWVNTITATPTSTATGTATATGTKTNTPPAVGYHSVIINEIAWAGTKANSDDEWIELYNTTNGAINLNDWILRSDDTSPIISLTGLSIPAKGFLVLARREGTFRDVTPALVYGDSSSVYSLLNSGEVVRLVSPSGMYVDTANSYFGYGFTKWAAGSASPNYSSMERASYFFSTPAEWFTFSGTPYAHDRDNNLVNGTPGRANWATSVTATPSRAATVVRTPTRTLTPPPPPPLIAINEFVPRPGRDWNNDGVVNVDDEYVELLNHGTVNVNLSGYSLDDEVNIGSSPYRLPSVTLRPGERYVFYGSETGLLLSDGGDGVRLLKPNGQLADAYNYSVVGYPDQSFCRLPDNGGADDWNQNCYPTPGLQNSLSGESAAPSGDATGELFCPIADTLPDDFAQAECEPYGNEIYRPEFWDQTGWYGENNLPGNDTKWPVFAD